MLLFSAETSVWGGGGKKKIKNIKKKKKIKKAGGGKVWGGGAPPPPPLSCGPVAIANRKTHVLRFQISPAKDFEDAEFIFSVIDRNFSSYFGYNDRSNFVTFRRLFQVYFQSLIYQKCKKQIEKLAII